MAVVKLVATLSSYGRRAVVVGGVADRYAGELARAGQSNRQRAGTGSASSECATRPPLWPAGMAEGNRETFGPRVGLSSHGSPAKGGPKSKCLARLKIARTSAGPPSLTISDRSRFPLPGSVGRTLQARRVSPPPGALMRVRVKVEQGSCEPPGPPVVWGSRGAHRCRAALSPRAQGPSGGGSGWSPGT